MSEFHSLYLQESTIYFAIYFEQERLFIVAFKNIKILFTHYNQKKKVFIQIKITINKSEFSNIFAFKSLKKKKKKERKEN